MSGGRRTTPRQHGRSWRSRNSSGLAPSTARSWLSPARPEPAGSIRLSTSRWNTCMTAMSRRWRCRLLYLQSPLALILETDTGLDQATAQHANGPCLLANAAAGDPTRVYVHGLSLGAWSSMYSIFNLYRVLNDHIDGALLDRAAVPSRIWNYVQRGPGSRQLLGPARGRRWLSFIRYASQYRGWIARVRPGARYASSSSRPRATRSSSTNRTRSGARHRVDVGPARGGCFGANDRFMPVVTQLQLALDMALALGVPGGYGHNYIAHDYIDPWAAVTAPEGWSDETSARLKEWCGQEWGQGCRRK